MICDWVLIWVEVVGGDGSDSGCGQWWLVAVSVAVIVGFIFAVVFLWWVSNGGWWLEFVIGDFLFCLSLVILFGLG